MLAWVKKNASSNARGYIGKRVNVKFKTVHTYDRKYDIFINEKDVMFCRLELNFINKKENV